MNADRSITLYWIRRCRYKTVCIFKHGLNIITYTRRCKYAVTEGMRNEVAAKGTTNLTGTNQSIVCDLTGIKQNTDDLTDNKKAPHKYLPNDSLLT